MTDIFDTISIDTEQTAIPTKTDVFDQVGDLREKKIQVAMSALRKIPASEFVPYMVTMKTDPFNIRQNLVRFIGRRLTKDPDTMDIIYEATDRVQREMSLKDPKKYAGIVAEIGKTISEFAVLPGGAKVGETVGKLALKGAGKFAAQQALQLPTAEESRLSPEEYLKRKAISTVESAVTGGIIGPIGKVVPNPWARIPLVTGGFMTKTALEGGTPDQILETGITIIGFEAAGLAQRGLYKKAVESAVKNDPDLDKVEPKILEETIKATIPDKIGETETVYHGTTVPTEIIKKEGVIADKERTGAISATDNPEIAKRFGDNVIEIKVPKNRILDLTDGKNEVRIILEGFPIGKWYNKEITEQTARLQTLIGFDDLQPEQKKWLANKGYIGIKIPSLEGGKAKGTETRFVANIPPNMIVFQPLGEVKKVSETKPTISEQQESIREYNKDVTKWIEGGRKPEEKPIPPEISIKPTIEAKPEDFEKPIPFAGKITTMSVIMADTAKVVDELPSRITIPQRIRQRVFGRAISEGVAKVRAVFIGIDNSRPARIEDVGWI
jgi:hypothetical protein